MPDEQPLSIWASTSPTDVDAHIDKRGRGAGFVVEVGTSLLLGAVVGVVSAFSALHTVAGLWVGVAATTLAVLALSLLLADAWSSSAAPIAAGLGWMLCVGYFAAGRPEGDVVVPGSAQGYAFLLLGLVAFAPGIRLGMSRQRPAATPEGLSGR